MALRRAVIFFLFSFVSVFGFAEDISLDLAVQPGNSAGSAQVELFPGLEETTSFRLFITSEAGDERTVETSNLAVTIEDLISHEIYTIRAVGLSSSGQITEASPNETVTVP